MPWWAQLPPFLYWVFFSRVSGFRSKFSRIALLRKRLQLESKKDLTTNGLILGFLWKMASFVDFISVWTEICKNCAFIILPWRHQFFSLFSFMGNLVCSLKMLVLFSHRNLQYRLISYSNAMQLYFLPLFVFQPIFLLSSGKTLWLLLKIINSVFQVSC